MYTCVYFLLMHKQDIPGVTGLAEELGAGETEHITNEND